MFEDQIGERLEGAQTFMLTNVLLYLLTPFRFFAPWIVLLVMAVLTQRDFLFQYMRRRKPLVWFVLGWFLVNVILFSLGNLMRSRYLLPTYPLLAVWLADMLMQSLQSSSCSRAATRIVRGLMLTAMGLGLVVAAIGWRLDPQILLGSVLFAGVTGLLYIAAFRRPVLPVLGGLESHQSSLRLRHWNNSSSQQSSRRRQGLSLIDCLSYSLCLSRLRLWMSGRRWSIRSGCCQAGVWSCRSFARRQIRITCGNFPSSWGRNESGRHWLIQRRIVIEECGAAYAPPPIAAIWAWLTTGDKASLTSTDRTPYYLIKQREAV